MGKDNKIKGQFTSKAEYHITTHLLSTVERKKQRKENCKTSKIKAFS